MKVKRSLSLEAAGAIIDRALDLGRAHNMSPLAVVVVDSAGVPIAFKSEDGCGVLRFNVALGKAFGGIGMGTSSRDMRDRMADRPSFANALAAASGGRFVPAPGGVLIVDEDDMVIGAVGISGDTSDKDEYAAIVAIHDAGYQSAPETFDPDWEKS